MFEALFLLFIALPIGLAFSAAIGVIIADAKGRSGLEGGAWGCLLGPIGWIIVGLLPTQEKVSPQTHRTCPYCAETVLRAARVCKHCNRELPDPGPPSERKAVPVVRMTRKERAALRRRNLRDFGIILLIMALGGVIGWALGLWQ